MTTGNGCGGKSWCCGMNLGILVLRLGIGALFMAHGIQKIRGGVEVWEKLGGAMGALGINAFPAFWGFMASFSEAVGGLFLVLGLLVRPFSALLAFTMLVAVIMLAGNQASFVMISNPARMFVVFVALLIIGGGDYSLGRKINGLRGHWFQ